MSGHLAVAIAAKLCDVDVVAAYPVTPQSEIVHYLAEFKANGQMDCECLAVESEHSALSALVGASAAGARTFTASAGPGIALLHEILWCASGMRLPIVIAVTNRSYSAPLSIWSDHEDVIAQRDSGCIQLFCESNQEVFDTVVQAFKIAEDSGVLLPVLVSMDGFILSHVVEPVEVPGEEDVREFLEPYIPKYRLNPDDPITFGPVAPPYVYMELKYQQEEAMNKALDVIKRVDREYGEKFGRRYDVMEEYKTDDADAVILTMGAITTTARGVVNRLREKAQKVGLIKLKLYRPFPKEELINVLTKFDTIGVVDKNIGFGSGGALFHEVRSALYGKNGPRVLGFITGLGGRDVTEDQIEYMLKKTLKGEIKEEVEWVGLRK
jgi:pyruvate ferredoxin oxidoreductase alpha subunit